jgi:ATP-dependent Clp protease ATP-binding subunit ClpA
LNTATLAPDSSVADVMEIISSTFNTSTFSLLMKMVNVVPFVPLQGDDLMQIVSHSIAVVEEAAASRFPNWKGRIDADFELFQFLVDRCLRQASCSRTAGRGVAQVVKGDVEPKVFDELRHQEKLFQGKFYGDVAIRPEVAMERIAIEFISHASASHEAKSEL